VKYAGITFVILAALSVGASAYRQARPRVANSSTSWVQLAKLSPSDPRDYHNGTSVAISGNVVAVGAPYGEVVSVYMMPSSGWGNMVETATLTASDGSPGGLFGNSVAIDGNTIIVGDPYAAPNQSGAVYVFVEPAGGWKGKLTQTAKLSTSEAAKYGAVGWSVAISGSTIVAGAPYLLNEVGEAFVYTEPAAGWANATETAKLSPSDGQANEEFGISVSASGNAVVVGSPYEAIGANQAQGGAYVYVEPASGWRNATQSAKLTASDGQQYDDFATSVSMIGQTIASGAVGANLAQGAVYIFVEPSGGWINATQSAKLTAAGGNQGDELGASVAASNNFVVAGAPWFSHSANDLTSPFFHEGTDYIFAKPATGWASGTQSAMVTGSDARLGAYLGSSVAINGNIVVSGALFNNYNLGAAYVFTPYVPQ
jgi:hypothetical protein